MAWYNKSLHALGEGKIDLPTEISTGRLKLSLVHGYTPDTSDGGHEFKSHFDVAGGVIDSTVVLTGASWTNRKLGFSGTLTLPDPGGATPDSTHALLWIDTGTASTSRLLAVVQLPTPHSWDGQDDTISAPNGLLEISPA